jgi:sulfur carrier protein ThiS
MRVRVQLMGLYKSKTPPEGILDVPAGGTIADALRKLDIDASQVQVVMLNGKPHRDLNRPLHEGDAVTVLSPVGGG